ncbi:MAG: hypothetical protein KDK76_05105 [Chlamydiia bacterium]|nr:hypothetical protein [Chlamydiia bacterium]
MNHTPEEDLTHHLKYHEEELHTNLLILNQLSELCTNKNLTEKEFLKQAMPLINTFSESNPLVAKEIKEALAKGDRLKIKSTIDKEKEALIHTLSTEIKEHKGINSQINNDQPTDS